MTLERPRISPARDVLPAEEPPIERWVVIPVALALMIVAGVIGWAIGDKDPAPSPLVVGPAVEQPVGDEVSLSGEIRSFITPRLFVLGSDAGGASVLVLAGELPFGLDEGSLVRVTGEARAIDDLVDRGPVPDADAILIVASDVTMLSPR